MSKNLLALVITMISLLSVTLAQGNSGYAQWKQQFGKNFNPSEDVLRAQVFIQNQVTINAHNNDPKKTYTMALNSFAGNTNAEL